MKDGKRQVAQKQVYDALKLLSKKDPKIKAVDLLEQALDNIKPKIEVRPRRIGGSVYQVPTPTRGLRQSSLAIRWLVSSARLRQNKLYHSFAEKLSAELTDALASTGSAVNKRLEVEKMAEANKAFSHLKW
jgi:small subunit ribosomal protein S7